MSGTWSVRSGAQSQAPRPVPALRDRPRTGHSLTDDPPGSKYAAPSSGFSAEVTVIPGGLAGSPHTPHAPGTQGRPVLLLWRSWRPQGAEETTEKERAMTTEITPSVASPPPPMSAAVQHA